MTDDEPPFPPHLAVWDPAQFPDKADWHWARFHFAPQQQGELAAIRWLSRGNANDQTTKGEKH